MRGLISGSLKSEAVQAEKVNIPSGMNYRNKTEGCRTHPSEAVTLCINPHEYRRPHTAEQI